MAKRWRLTRQARDDLDAIYRDGIERFGQVRADRYLDGLEEAFVLLTQFPGLGRIAGTDELPLRLQVKGARVIVDQASDAGVEIVRLYSQSENWLANFR